MSVRIDSEDRVSMKQISFFPQVGEGAVGRGKKCVYSSVSFKRIQHKDTRRPSEPRLCAFGQTLHAVQSSDPEYCVKMSLVFVGLGKLWMDPTLLTTCAHTHTR